MEVNQINDVLEKLANKELIIFCGAGISYNSGLPLANQLKHFILEKLSIQIEDIDCLMSSDLPFEGLMQCLIEQSSVLGIAEIINIFCDPHLLPSNTHSALADLYKLGYIKLILTTNIDNLIEKALENRSLIYKSLFTEEDFSNFLNRKSTDTGALIVRIHGLAEEYNEDIGIRLDLISGKHYSQERVDLLKYVFSTGDHKGVLVLGYSCSDVFDIVPIVSSISEKNKEIYFVEHYISNDNELEVKQKKFLSLFGEFPNTRIRTDTDEFIKEIQNRFSLEINNIKQDFDWQSNVSLWSERIGFVKKKLISGRLFNLIGRDDISIKYYQEGLKYIKVNDQNSTESFMGNYRKLMSRESVLHLLRKKQMITGDDMNESFIDNAKLLAYLGVAYKNINDLESATHHIEKAIDISRHIESVSCLSWLNSLANVCMKQGKYDEAEMHYKIILSQSQYFERKKLQAVVLGNLASLYAQEKNQIEKAQQYYKKAFEIAEDVGDIRSKALHLNGLAGISFVTGDYSNAKRLLEQAREIASQIGDINLQNLFDENMGGMKPFINPINDFDFELLAFKYHMDDNPERANIEISKAIAINPNKAELYATKSSIMSDNGNHTDALSAINIAIDLVPNIYSYYIIRGTINDYLGHTIESINDYTKALELKPDCAEAYYERGIVYRDQRNFNTALDDFKAAIKLDESYVAAYENIGNIYYDRSKTEKAIFYLEKATRLGSDFALKLLTSIRRKPFVGVINKGLDYLKKGNYNKAIKEYDKVISSDKNVGIAYSCRGLCYSKIGMIDKAFQDFNIAISLDPSDYVTYNRLGNLYSDIGQSEDAIRQYNQALKYEPNSGEILCNIGVVLYKQSKWKEALSYFHKAAELGNSLAIKLSNMIEQRLQE